MKIESKHEAGSCGNTAEKAAWGGIWGWGGRKKKGVGGRTGHVNYVPGNEFFIMYVPCQKLNCSKCKLFFFPLSFYLSLVPPRVRKEEAGTGRGVIECLLSYCITTELYDPALTLECMQPYNSEEQDNILLLITHSFSSFFIWLQASFNMF